MKHRKGGQCGREGRREFFLSFFLSWTTTTTTSTSTSFPRTRSLFSGPHYPYRHGYDCVSSSPPASGLEPRRRKGESERERGEKKLLDECFFREKTKQGLFAHPRVFFSLSSPCSHSAHPQTPREDRGGPAGLVRRGGWRRKTATREAMRRKPFLVFLFEPRGEREKNEVKRQRRRTASEARRRGEHKRRKKRDERERKTRLSFSYSLFPSIDFTHTHEDKCPQRGAWIEQ